jgi:hypothetical protein
MTIDRLQHAHAREDHRAVVLRSLGHHAGGGLNLWHRVFGLRDVLRQPGDRLLERPQFTTIGQFNRLAELALPALIRHSAASYKSRSESCRDRPSCLSTKSSMPDGTSRSCKSQRRRNSAATWAEISRDQPPATLKAMTRTGLPYCPSSRSSMTVSTSAVSTSLSQ